MAALSGKSSKVKLTIGRSLRSLNGVVLKYRDKRLLTRACNGSRSGFSAIAVIDQKLALARRRARVRKESRSSCGT